MPDPIVDIGAFLSQVTAAFSARDWLLVSALATYALVAILRSQRGRIVSWVPWFATRLGGYALAIMVASLSALALGMAGHLGWRDVAQHVVVDSLAAIGFYQASKDKKNASLSDRVAR